MPRPFYPPPAIRGYATEQPHTLPPILQYRGPSPDFWPGSERRFCRRVCLLTVVVASSAAAISMVTLLGAASGFGLFVFLLAIWNVAPYVAMACTAWATQRSRSGQIVLLLTTIILSLLGWVAFSEADRDAQGGLVLLVMPVIQWLVCTCAIPFAIVMAYRARKRAAEWN